MTGRGFNLVLVDALVTTCLCFFLSGVLNVATLIPVVSVRWVNLRKVPSIR